MSDLALLGGSPTIPDAFPVYASMGKAEEEAVLRVVRSGCLSGFYGSWEDGFLGGAEVQAFEAEWGARFGAAHTVTVNSATSGLIAAIGAAGIGPGDEVIVPATTMSATAMAPIVYGGIPVFADIDADTFCIDIASVRANLTARTRAIIAVNLFGQAAPLAALRSLCDENGLVLIEDNAQGPLATENGRYCGTIGHIGVFSLNYHKHIHTGEGGVCTTEDSDLARKMQFIRNHAEAVVEDAGVENLTNMLGFNLRMTELSAAVGRVQLTDIADHVARRENFAAALSKATQGLDGIQPPHVRDNCRHVYYVWAMRHDAEVAGMTRNTFVAALQAEGVPCFPAYVAPLYTLPMFRARIAIGREGYPFNLGSREYGPGLCPVAERLHTHEIVGIEPCAFDFSEADAPRIADAIAKVLNARSELADWRNGEQVA